MNRLRFKYISFIVASIVIGLTACVKEDYDFSKVSVKEYDPYIAIPVVNSTLTINDILVNADKQGAISVGSDGFLTLIYKGNLLSKKASEFISIGNQSFSNFTFDPNSTVAVTAFNNAAVGSVFGPYTQNMQYNLNTTYQIDSIYLKTGTLLDIGFNNTFNAEIKVDFTLTSLKDPNTGAAYTQSFTLNPNSSGHKNYDIGGYILNLNDNGTRNVVKLNYKVEMTKKGNLTTGSPVISFSPSLTNINFSKFIGYIGTLSNSIAPYSDTIGISIFNNNSTDPLTSGSFYLEDPSIDARISSYLGCNVGVTFEKLDAYTEGANGQNINTNTLAGTSATQNITVNGASNFNTAGITTIGINKTNTPNIVPFVNSKPKNIIYKVNATPNPGSTGYIRNFFTDTSMFKVDFDIIMPMWGTASNYMLVDTTEFSLGGMDQLKSLTMRTFVENGFPIDMDIAVLLTDSLYNPIVYFIPSGSYLVKGAPVDANGIVNGTNIAKNEYIINRTDLLKMKNVKYSIITAKASTTNSASTSVKFYNHYKMNVRLGVQAQPVINFGSGN